MQKKGIVMQIANGQAVVMTSGREFKKIPFVAGMLMGQEVEIPSETIVPMPQKRFWNNKTFTKRFGMVAASLVLAVGLWSAQSMFSEPSAYAYVTVDINPSIELSIDNHKRVVQATALNVEAEKVLTDLHLKGKSVEEAVKTLAETAKNQGYLKDNTEVIITASPAVQEEQVTSNSIDLNAMEDELVLTVETLASTYGTEVEVEGVVVSQQVRTAAKEAGVSSGKYALYLSAQSNGIDIDLEQLKHQPVSRLVDVRGTELANIVHQIQGGKQLDGLLDTLKKDGKNALFQGASKAAVVPGKQEPNENDKKVSPGHAKKQVGKQEDKNGNGNDNANGNGQGNSNGQGSNSGKPGSTGRESNDKGSKDSHSSTSTDDKSNHGGKDKESDNRGNSNGHGKGSDKHDGKQTSFVSWLFPH